ncbi:hypothetical protein L1887_14968 [Cichorium endivia]|nr:hypothetical protein L1887_14968 [Cichorium endivia]
MSMLVLQVVVDGIWKACPEAGGPVQFPGFNGELICPAYHELCSVNPLLVSKKFPNSCNSNGDCVDGKCLCFVGFDGHDCSKGICPSNCNGNGKCLKNGICQCADGFTGIDCSTAVCDEQCSLHGGVCDNEVLVRNVPPDSDESVSELVQHLFIANHPYQYLVHKVRFFLEEQKGKLQ